MKVYTKTGDKGETSLISERVSKSHARINLIGKMDEVMVLLGKLISTIKYDEKLNVEIQLKSIYRNFFIIQSKIADKNDQFKMIIREEAITELENEIDLMNASLPQLKNFIYYIGVSSTMITHEIRVNIREAERLAVSVNEYDQLDAMLLMYLNRSSDYFYTLARYINHLHGVDEEIIKL